MQYLVLDCKIMFVTSLIMLVGTEADVIFVELGIYCPSAILRSYGVMWVILTLLFLGKPSSGSLLVL